MYSVGQPFQANIIIESESYTFPSISQIIILLFCVAFTLKTDKHITKKQALFGESYTEDSTSVTIKKSELLTSKNTAESLFVALFIRWIILNLSFDNINIQLGGIQLEVNKKIFTYWIKLFDLAFDDYNNPDMTKTFSPNNF